MTDIAMLPDEEQPGENKSALIEGRLDHTRNIRDRMVAGLASMFDELVREHVSGEKTDGGNAKMPMDIEQFEKISKLLLKAAGDNDKVDLTRLRFEVDKGMNDDNIAAAKARTSELLSQLGRQTVHPGARADDDAIDGESVRIVTEEERDKRLGFDALDRFGDVEFSPGVLIQGRVEENSDAFYARLKGLTDHATASVQAQVPDQQASEKE